LRAGFQSLGKEVHEVGLVFGRGDGGSR